MAALSMVPFAHFVKFCYMPPMTENRTPLLRAYDRVIAKVKEVYAAEHGHEHGAMNWFTRQLGTSRQTIDYWGRRAGIPPSRVSAVAKITGLSEDEIRPETELIEIPSKAWKYLCRNNPKEIINQATIHPKGHKYG